MTKGTSLGELICCHLVLDMIQVDAPLSIIHQWTVVFLILKGIWKETSEGRHGSMLSKSKVIRWVFVGSTTPNCESKAFLCEGKLWRTSNTNMGADDCTRLSIRL
jgi:hypothetical protein